MSLSMSSNPFICLADEEEGILGNEALAAHKLPSLSKTVSSPAQPDPAKRNGFKKNAPPKAGTDSRQPSRPSRPSETPNVLRVNNNEKNATHAEGNVRASAGAEGSTVKFDNIPSGKEYRTASYRADRRGGHRSSVTGDNKYVRRTSLGYKSGVKKEVAGKATWGDPIESQKPEAQEQEQDLEGDAEDEKQDSKQPTQELAEKPVMMTLDQYMSSTEQSAPEPVEEVRVSKGLYVSLDNPEWANSVVLGKKKTEEVELSKKKTSTSKPKQNKNMIIFDEKPVTSVRQDASYTPSYPRGEYQRTQDRSFGGNRDSFRPRRGGRGRGRGPHQGSSTERRPRAPTQQEPKENKNDIKINSDKLAEEFPSL